LHAEATPRPQDRSAQTTLGVIVGRFDPRDKNKRPERGFQFEQFLSEVARLRVGHGSPCAKQLMDADAQRFRLRLKV